MTSEPSTVPAARQARSRLTQDRIFVAGTRLLELGGTDALTVAAVAETAGVAVGSVYRRFGDKEGLLRAIQARFTADFRAELSARVVDTGLVATTPPDEVIAAAVLGVADTFREHTKLMRVFILLGTRHGAVLDEGAAASIEGGRTFRAVVMLAAASLRHHPDVESAIDFAYRLTYATCAHRVVHGEHLESARPLAWNELIDHLRRAVTAYLLVASPLSRADPPVSSS